MASKKQRKRNKTSLTGDYTGYQSHEASLPTPSGDQRSNSRGGRTAQILEDAGFLDEMATFILEQFSKAQYESLLNDYMESELFLIDGDSLLIMCATNQSLKQGQNLHFFFLVEQFLINLTKRGARFNIVFFEEMEPLYTGRPDIISLRTQLMLHLEKNTDIVVNSFSSFLCQQWNAFLTDQAPCFLMASDEGLNSVQTCFLNMLIISALGKQMNVVLTAGQESDNLRIFGYQINTRNDHVQFMQKNSEKIRHTLQKLNLQATEKNSHFMQHMETIQKQVHHEISKTNLTDGSDIRIIICAMSCSMTLRTCAEMEKMEQHDSPSLTLDEVADLCKMLCLSMALMITLPLSQRAKSRIINGNWDMATLPIINLLKRHEIFALNLLRTNSKKTNGRINWTHISDLSDELLLKNIAYYYEKEVSADPNLEYGEDVDQMFKDIWEKTLKLSHCENQLYSSQLRTTSKPFLSKNATVEMKGDKIKNFGLIPMQSDVIEHFAGDIVNYLVPLNSNDPILTSLVHAKSYNELTHWHTRRPLSDDYDRTKCEPIKDNYALRNYQKFQTFQRFYGKSLGMTICKQIVLKGAKMEGNHKEHKAYGKKKETQVKKKDKIIEENRNKIAHQEEKKQLEMWKSRGSSFVEEIRRNIFCGMRQAEQFLCSLHSKSLKLKAQIQALEACFVFWTDHCKKDESRDMKIAVEIMKLIQAILNDHEDISREDQKKIAPYLNHLGFRNLGQQLQNSKVVSTETEESKYSVHYASSRFQLLFMGPYMKKDERTDPDPRVQHFIPDTWQRELLDVVDNNESAVIVAPTSSGKTYASYYCMEKVLTESNDGVVVYVAPTKALVNQVVATVINQFTKDLPKGLALCGVFTRDYRCDALNCQVLVTVPQCLEILLLSPHRQSWVKRIKYLIFDEVHCLGGEIGAEVWDHILVMIRCPFLALSATISNPEHLTEWLQSVKQYWKLQDELESHLPQKATKRRALEAQKVPCQVRLVLHDKRFNDLENYVSFEKKGDIYFHHFHPCAALTIRQIKKYGIPKDMAFSPLECLQLYDAMVVAWPDWPREEDLDPENSVHLKNKICITKSDVAKYEEELKKELCNWVENALNKEVSEVLKSFQCFPQFNLYTSKCQTYFPQLVEKLKQLDKLPALFFAFDIKLVEKLAKKLGQELTSNWQKTQTQQLVREVEKLQVKEKRMKKTLRTSTKDETFTKAAAVENVKQRLGKISEVSSEYTYAGYGAVDSELLQEMIEKLRHVRNSEQLISLAERGIGYHHGAMQYKERRFVEMLFRMGYIRVVTATSSLALGINMPCKSVVFLQDSTYLDPLNYRQMAGRAGRRGLDLEGSVYFFNVPITKVKKLIKSDVPELRGQFPLSVSLILRLMLLATKADDKEDAKAKVLSVLKHSLMTFKQHSKTQMLKVYFLFSLQFLVCEGYLDKDCEPLELTGLVTHLHYHEPSNFVFVNFLRRGLFHNLCKPSIKYPGTFPDSVFESLVLVLANLFGREYYLKFAGPFFQSKVCLEKLPDDFEEVVKDYNRKVAVIFGQCILDASKMADIEKEYQLPLSKINFSSKQCVNSGLVGHLMSCSEGRSGISPFACLSGITDFDLKTLEHVNSITLSLIDIPQKYFPVFNLKKTDSSGRRMHLNAYALDFFKHGSIQAIVTDNRFNEGDAVNKLKDFYLSIAAISVSLMEMCEDEHDPVSLAFKQLREKFHRKLAPVESFKLYL